MHLSFIQRVLEENGVKSVAIKNEVAAVLEKRRGRAVSGQELADMLGVSRAAVWKAVKQLQDDGYHISAGRNRGYILENETDVLTAEGIRLNLPEKYRDVQVEVYRTVASTNTEAKAAALRGAAHGSIFAADEQTAGRGRFGKAFYSPADTGLYMSVILKPHKPLTDCFFITAAAACAITGCIEELCGINAGIKWVNDIFYNGRKICGILTEAMSDFESGMADVVIVGIGLNVRTTEFPEEISGVAGSLNVFAERNRLCADIAARLLDLTETGDNAALMEEYRSRSLVIGHDIVYQQDGREFTGRALGIDDAGRLIVENNGELILLRSGEISIRDF